MNLLVIHQSLPGQYKHLIPALARDPANQVVCITQDRAFAPPGVRMVTYKPSRHSHASTHHYIRLYENAVLNGQAVLRACMPLRGEGFRPDVILVHPGWGEALFLRDVFPRSRILSYCEFYYHGRGADVGFDPDTPTSLDAICRARARNAHLLLSLESCDAGISPTQWQRDRHPAPFHDKISVVFDGIDTRIVCPAQDASLRLPDGTVLTAQDQVVTYVARNLEPYRGFPSFMRAVPLILRHCPAAHILIVGGDNVSYGQPPPGGGTWRQAMLNEVGPLDPTRVHMPGQVGYRDYLKVLQISTAHVYLTVPFVLSWSCIEAMSAGCILIGSCTPPVQEVIEHGQNGLLVDFFNPVEIAETVAATLNGANQPLRAVARATAQSRFDLSHCLPKQLELVNQLAVTCW